MEKSTLKTSLLLSDDVIVAGRISSSQDGIVVMGGAFPHAIQLDTETARKLWSLSRIKPQNVCQGGVACTLNTRYENAAIKDYISLRHYPKSAVLYIYETL